MKISWVDASAADQRRMQEIAGLFTEKETVDELGLGPVRDALGSILFPGSSTLHTRAKYFLLVPWFHAHAGQNASHELVRDVERQFIHHMHAARGEDRDGLYGQNSANVVRLASDVHRNALISHGIQFDPGNPSSRRFLTELGYEDAVHAPLLHPQLPAPPAEFPQVPGGFTLNGEEARWLKERILSSSPHTGLAHFLQYRPAAGSTFPWEDPAAKSISGPAAQHMRIAEQFATTVHGAQLLYNLMLSEKQRDLFAETGDADMAKGDPDHYRAELLTWAADVTALPPWDIEEIISLVTRWRVAPLPLLDFLRNWDEVLQSASPEEIADHPAARELIETRERAKKGSQSRFRNRSLLANWGGSSAASRLTMRWGASVRRILLDIHDGLRDA